MAEKDGVNKPINSSNKPNITFFAKKEQSDGLKIEIPKQVIKQDAKDYYAAGSDSPYKRKLNSKKVVNEDLRGECYIGFAKVLKEELQTFEMKDSAVFEQKIHRLSSRKNNASQQLDVLQMESTQSTSKKYEVMQKSLKTSKQKKFSESLWFCGKKVGEMSG